MKNGLIIASVVISLFTIWYYFNHPLGTKVKINKSVFRVDVAVTEAEKIKGLGGRDALGPSEGMLFVYDHKEPYKFWMKDMRFPLDFIWIDGKTVVDITANVSPPGPNGQLTIYTPDVPVDKILEVSAGTVQRVGIKPGDEVTVYN